MAVESGSRQTGQVDGQQVELIIARLTKIRGMQVSSDKVGDDFVQMQERLASVISSLEETLGPGATASSFGALAEQLVMVEQLYRSSGLTNVANVLTSVQEALIKLASTSAAGEVQPPVPQRFQPPPSALAEAAQRSHRVTTDEAELAWPEPPQQSSLLPLVLLYGGCGFCLVWFANGRLLGLAWPSAVAAALVLGLVPGAWLAAAHQSSGPLFLGARLTLPGMLLSLVIVLWCLGGMASLGAIVSDSFLPSQPPPPPVEPQPTATATPEPQTRRTVVPEQSQLLDEQALAQIPVETELAVAALHDNDLERAMRHFAVAAALDPYHRLVLETAQSIVNRLLEQADEAATEGEWDLAEDRIAGARTLAARFYLETDTINQTYLRHQAMDRFQDITPGNTAALKAAVGKVVRITLKTYETLPGRLIAVEQTAIILDVSSGMGGGQVSFTKQVPLSSIRELRVYQRQGH